MFRGRKTNLSRMRRTLVSGLILSALGVSGWLMAEPVTSLKRASEIAQQAFGGQVVKAEEVEFDQKKVFVIRIVNDGRVRDVMIDPANGAILNP